MATHIGEKGYRIKRVDFEKLLEKAEKVAAAFPNLLYIPLHLEHMGTLPIKMGELLTSARTLRGDEVRAEKELTDPTEEMYTVTRQIHAGLIYLGVADDIIEEIFSTGRPDPLNTPPEQVKILLEHIDAAFEGRLKDHEIALQKGPTVKQLLEERTELIERERVAEKAVLTARRKLVECSREMDRAHSVLVHLSRADNINNKGVYRALFPLKKESKPDESTIDTTDNFLPGEIVDEEIILGGSD